MPCISRTTSATTLPPWVAAWLLVCASCWAWVALSALWRTAAFSSSIAAAVCSSVLACASVRADKSALPLEICSAALETASACWRTLATMSIKPCCICATAARTLLLSSGRMRMARVKSPWVTSPTNLRKVYGSAPKSVIRLRTIQMPAASANAKDNRLIVNKMLRWLL